MRAALTVLLAAAFAVGFLALVGLHGVIDVLTDGDAVVQAATEARARDAAVEVLAVMVEDHLAGSVDGPTIAPGQVREVIAGVIGEAWFTDALRGAHAVLLDAVEGARSTAELDLTPLSDQLGRALRELRARAERDCAAVFDPRVCADDQEASRLYAAYDRDVLGAVDAIPPRIDLLAGGGSSGDESVEVERARAVLARARAWRLGGVAALVLAMALIAGLNGASRGRARAAGGLTHAVAAVLYLGAGASYHKLGRDRVAALIAEHRAARDRSAFDRAVGEGGERVAVAVVGLAVRRHAVPVAITGLVGLATFTLGLVARR
jgi:hypothetical protein